MNRWVQIGLVVIMATGFSSPAWAGGNSGDNGSPFGQPGNGDPKYAVNRPRPLDNHGIETADQHIPANACGQSNNTPGNSAGGCPLHPASP